MGWNIQWKFLRVVFLIYHQYYIHFFIYEIEYNGKMGYKRKNKKVYDTCLEEERIF